MALGEQVQWSNDLEDQLRKEFAYVSPSQFDTYLPILIQQFKLRHELDAMIEDTLLDMGVRFDHAAA